MILSTRQCIIPVGVTFEVLVNSVHLAEFGKIILKALCLASPTQTRYQIYYLVIILLSLFHRHRHKHGVFSSFMNIYISDVQTNDMP